MRPLFVVAVYLRRGSCDRLSSAESVAQKGTRLMFRRAAQQGVNSTPLVSSHEKIELVKWHIDRYDPLRRSTTNRSAGVLRAGSILPAAAAAVLSQLSSRSATLRG